MAGGWQPGDEFDGRLFEQCYEVLEAARQLEALLSFADSEVASPAILGCLSATFDSLANTTLMLHDAAGSDPLASSAVGGDRVVQLDRLLFTINQNLRFASQAAELGRAAISPIDAAARR